MHPTPCSTSWILLRAHAFSPGRRSQTPLIIVSFDSSLVEHTCIDDMSQTRNKTAQASLSRQGALRPPFALKAVWSRVLEKRETWRQVRRLYPVGRISVNRWLLVASCQAGLVLRPACRAHLALFQSPYPVIEPCRSVDNAFVCLIYLTGV